MAPRIQACAAALVSLALMAAPAPAHEAPSGWSYDRACCSDKDCRPVPKARVETREDGYYITWTGEVIPYGDRRLRRSQDEEYHWCGSTAGESLEPTDCLYVPGAGV